MIVFSKGLQVVGRKLYKQRVRKFYYYRVAKHILSRPSPFRVDMIIYYIGTSLCITLIYIYIYIHVNLITARILRVYQLTYQWQNIKQFARVLSGHIIMLHHAIFESWKHNNNTNKTNTRVRHFIVYNTIMFNITLRILL